MTASALARTGSTGALVSQFLSAVSSTPTYWDPLDDEGLQAFFGLDDQGALREQIGVLQQERRAHVENLERQRRALAAWRLWPAVRDAWQISFDRGGGVDGVAPVGAARTDMFPMSRQLLEYGARVTEPGHAMRAAAVRRARHPQH